jgi:peptidoglycan hydrolase-like protein with peptidoglycan-binding domain
MKKITQVSIGVLTLVASATFGASSLFAYTTIGSQLDLYESNNDVTNLQTFFKDNSSVYPEGLVTGYFGGLTRSAVQRFQTQYGIVSSGSAATTGYGRVGPSTLASINDTINHGGWPNMSSSDASGPSIYSVNQSVTNNSATFGWYTNENATAKIAYNTSPLIINEGDINSVGFGAINGYNVTNDNIARTSQQVTLSGLQPNTTYYYMIISTDASGNISVVGPNNTFRTNQ